MKKIVSLLLLVCLISFSGCGLKSGNSDIIEEEPGIGIAEEGKDDVAPSLKFENAN